MGQLDQLEAQLAEYKLVIDLVAPGDPLFAQVNAAVQTLRTMADGSAPAATADAARQARDQLGLALRDFVDKWKRELGRTLLRGLPELPPVQHALATADWLGGDELALPGELGPLTLRVGLSQRSIAPSLSVQGQPNPLALAPLPVGLALPEGVAASLRGPFPAQGALRVLADGIGGALRLPLGPVTVDALASLRRLPDGAPSFLAILGVSFTPGIQLSFGFALDRVGGVVGIERRVDNQALGREIRSGAASASLFAPSGANPLKRLTTAERLFPPAPGNYVVGPLFGLAWLSLGPDATLVHVDLGVLVQLGGPVTVTLVGSAELKLTELLRLHMDLAGSIDTGRGRIGVDISVDGRVLGAFRISGDAAFRAVTSGGGSVVFSAGGFYPGFDPRPAEIGALRRLSFGPDVSIPGFGLRVEGYVAVTSNTFQLGGRLDATFDAVLISASGALGLDALVQFRPFHFRAKVFGRFAVEALGTTFCGISLDGSIEGPGPISLSAQLTIETFLKDIHWNETFTFGDGQADRVAGIGDLVVALHERAGAAGLLKASAPEDGEVLLAPRAGPVTPRVVVAPLGTLLWSQRHTPLQVHCDRFENGPLVPPGQGVVVTVDPPALKRNDETDSFAPGAYLELSESQALHVPAFEPLKSGVRIGFDDVLGALAKQPPSIKLLRLPLVGGQVVLLEGNLSSLGRHGDFQQVAERGSQAPSISARPPAVRAVADAWRTSDGASHTSLTAAWQHARYRSGSLPLHATDPVLDTKLV